MSADLIDHVTLTLQLIARKFLRLKPKMVLKSLKVGTAALRELQLMFYADVCRFSRLGVKHEKLRADKQHLNAPPACPV